jgi:hypothetical protein
MEGKIKKHNYLELRKNINIITYTTGKQFSNKCSYFRDLYSNYEASYVSEQSIQKKRKTIILYICILSHIAISLSLSLFLSVFCAACQCFETLFSILNTCHF